METIPTVQEPTGEAEETNATDGQVEYVGDTERDDYLTNVPFGD